VRPERWTPEIGAPRPPCPTPARFTPRAGLDQRSRPSDPRSRKTTLGRGFGDVVEAARGGAGLVDDLNAIGLAELVAIGRLLDAVSELLDEDPAGGVLVEDLPEGGGVVIDGDEAAAVVGHLRGEVGVVCRRQDQARGAVGRDLGGGQRINGAGQRPAAAEGVVGELDDAGGLLDPGEAAEDAARGGLGLGACLVVVGEPGERLDRLGDSLSGSSESFDIVYSPR
jgi:hypothetical protein